MQTDSKLKLRSWVCDSWVEGEGEGTPLFNPTTGEEIGRASSAGVDFAAALHHARYVGGPALRALNFSERGALLLKMAESLHARREELLALATESGGATRGDAKFDVDGGISTLSAYAKMAEQLGEAHFLLDGDSIRLARNPRFIGQHVLLPRVGVAIHINAFNFPVWGMAEKAAVALLAGMPVVSKPATSTSALAVRAGECWVEDGILPPGAFSWIAGSPGDLLDHVQGQDVVAFTGSAATAERIRATPAVIQNSVRVNVEADSLNAAVLGPDVEPGSATWELFLREVVVDMTQKAGQKCTAIRRICIPTDRISEVREALCEELAGIGVGNPQLRGVRTGPLANTAQLRDIRDGLAELMECCDLVFGESGPGSLRDIEHGQGCFQQPVLLQAKDSAMADLVHQREVFGPVSTLLTYTGEVAEAVDLIRRGGGGLVTSVYTDDRSFATQMMVGIAPFHGRLHFGSAKIAEHSMGPGTVLPTMVHGGPGRAGGGEELGGLRGLSLYLQRTALQGDDPMIASMCEAGIQLP